MSIKRTSTDLDVKAEDVPLSEQLGKCHYGILERLKEWETLLNNNNEWRNIVSSFTSSKQLTSRTPASRLTNIKLFTSYLAVGVYPPSEVLFNIAASFAEYLDNDQSLESAFGVVAKQKVGTPVKEEQDKRLRQDVLFRMAVYRVEDENLTIEEAAERVCYKLGVDKPEPETFARHYRNESVGKSYENEYRDMLNYQSGK